MNLIKILQKSLEIYSQRGTFFEKILYETFVSQLSQDDLEKLSIPPKAFKWILRDYPELVSDKTIKSLSVEELIHLPSERLTKIHDPDWWRKLVASEKGRYFIHYCPCTDVIEEYIDSGRPVEGSVLHTRKDLPIEIRVKAFVRTGKATSGSLFSTVVESFPYRDWTRDEVAQYSISLYKNVVHRLNDVIKYLSNWSESYIREHWNTNIYFKKFALLSRNCPADLIKHVLMYSNMFKEVKAIALTNPNCPPSLKLRYSNDPTLGKFANINKTGEDFQDFFVY